MASMMIPGSGQAATPYAAAPAPQAAGRGQIGGALPFAGMAAAAAMPTDLASLGGHYAAAYNSALAMNQSNYTNILAGYQQTMAQQTAAQDAIANGYTGLYNDVLGQLSTQGGAQRQQINDDYARGLGAASQRLIDRGLGNSTVQAAVARGLEFDRAKAGNALSEQVARQNAEYMSRLGLAGLDYRDRANMQNTGLAQAQLAWMNSVNAPYPDMGAYAALAAQYGAAEEARRNRDEFDRGNRFPGNPPPAATVSGLYGRHFSDGFSFGDGGGAVQIGGGGFGGGSGGGVDGRQAIGLGAYYTPSEYAGAGGQVSYQGYDDPYGYTESPNYVPLPGGGSLDGYDYNNAGGEYGYA